MSNNYNEPNYNEPNYNEPETSPDSLEALVLSVRARISDVLRPAEDAADLESPDQFVASMKIMARGDRSKERAGLHAKYVELKALCQERRISPQTMQAYLAIFLQDRKMSKQTAILQQLAKYYLGLQ